MTMTDTMTADTTVAQRNAQLAQRIVDAMVGFDPTVRDLTQLEVVVQQMANQACDIEPERTDISDNLQDGADLLSESRIKFAEAVDLLHQAWTKLGVAAEARKLPRCESQ